MHHGSLWSALPSTINRVTKLKKIGKVERKSNKLVSSSTLSRAERHAIQDLRVVTGIGRKGLGKYTSIVRQRSEELYTSLPAADDVNSCKMLLA